MIQATIFDLDGTLVQTEQMKAVSYARAAVELCPHTLTEAEVIEAFKDVVGLSRREVALALMERFHLEEQARARMAEFDVTRPWQVYLRLRMQIYNAMLADADMIRAHQWPYTVQVLRHARDQGCHTALATMSYCPEVTRILKVLDLSDEFDFVASREDVHNGKPDPEIYLLVAAELKLPPAQCLVIEDSVNGVKAALAAGMPVVAVSTDFTREALHRLDTLDKRWLVDDHAKVAETVRAAFAAF